MKLFQVELETQDNAKDVQYIICDSFGEAETTINTKIAENKWGQTHIHSIQLLTNECETTK